jgi:uncharacterized protein (DUF305 family)
MAIQVAEMKSSLYSLRYMRKIVALIMSISLLSGCAAAPQANSEYSAADISFAEMMIPHHEQAIVMSEIALTNSSSEEILVLAQEIKDAQSPEIVQMKNWTGVNSSTHMGHMMDGMLSESQIQQLRDSEGAIFDRLFLEGMIAHHEGAITMAQKVTESENEEVAALAAAIIEAQEKEIAFMKELIKFY